MLRAMAPLMERHFNIRIRDEAVTAAVRLSHRYITGRQLPDKAISVLDTACARVALGQSAAPAALEAAEKSIEHVAAEIAALERDDDGPRHAARLKILRASHGVHRQEHAAHKERWRREQAIVADIGRRRAALDAGAGDTPEIRAQIEELAAVQGESAMVPIEVDAQIVAAIVSGWTGIPLGKMVKDDIRTVLNLGDALQQRILGQPHAIEAVAQRVRTSRAQLDDPNKPAGVFMFVGPSGVGKTETALALAELLYGGERKLITINMSEYQEAHSVSGLKGSPPGYVGYGQGGVLTEAVRRRPYSVVLLDEVEKAHPDVMEIFYQVFDKGFMEDSEGQCINFRNTLIILTSNLASNLVMNACEAGGADTASLTKLIRPEFDRFFHPALMGRLRLIPYQPVMGETLAKIIRLKLNKVCQRFENAVAGASSLTYSEKIIEFIASRCWVAQSGAREVDAVINSELLPLLADKVLVTEGKADIRLRLGMSKGKLTLVKQTAGKCTQTS